MTKQTADLYSILLLSRELLGYHEDHDREGTERTLKVMREALGSPTPLQVIKKHPDGTIASLREIVLSVSPSDAVPVTGKFLHEILDEYNKVRSSAFDLQKLVDKHQADELRAELEPFPPVPMVLTCPLCSARHIDEGEFASKPHHTHACQSCGLTWRPALVPTVGVQFLPGFKNE